jgi:hypothetical protein
MPRVPKAVPSARAPKASGKERSTLEKPRVRTMQARAAQAEPPGVTGERPEAVAAAPKGKLFTAGLSKLQDWNRRLGQYLQPRGDGNGFWWKQSIRLRDEKPGVLAIDTVGAWGLGEPHLTVAFVNKTTGERTEFTLDENGCLPADARVKGNAGDWFSVLGRRDLLGFSLAAARSEWFNAGGPLKASTVQGLKNLDVSPFVGAQVHHPDCWFIAALHAIAAVRPELIPTLMTAGKHQVGVVLFDVKDHWFHPTTYLVDDRFTDEDVYTPPALSEDRKVWIRLAERAMAQRRGSLNMGGGVAQDGFEAILGAPAKLYDLTALDPQELKAKLLEAKRLRLPMAVGSGRQFVRRAVNAHAYSIREVIERPNGDVIVEIHNPYQWGHLTLKSDELGRWLSQLSIAGLQDTPAP